MATRLQTSLGTDLQPFQSQLCEACRNGNLERVKELMEVWKRAAAPGQKLKFGAALNESSAHRHFDVTMFLLKEGAEMDALGRGGSTPLQLQNAAEEGRNCAANPPVSPEVGVDLDRESGPVRKQGRYAPSRSQSKVVAISSSEVNERDSIGRTALHRACQSGNTESVELLLNAGARVDVQDSEGRTPLMLAAASYGGLRATRLLLKNGDLDRTAVNRIDMLGLSALYFACQSGNTEAVELLLNAGACVDVQSNDQITPLMLLAKHNGAFGVVRKLLIKSDDLGFALSRINKDGLTALHYACRGRRSSAQTVELLLNAGAHVPVDVQDKYQHTPLMCASVSDNSEAVRLLILHGADVNIETNFNCTALSFAARGNHIECGILLVEGGANVHLPEVRSAISAKPSFKDTMTQALSFQTKKAICVVGNAFAGKSTLVASLKNEEANIVGKFWNYYFGSRGVSQRTTGIEPVPLNSKHYGSVMFFDFAGQQEYHGPHELFLKSILSRGLSTVTAIVVVKATEEGPAIVDQLNRWLYPLSQASVAVSNPVRIIVIASNIDMVKKPEMTDTKRKLEKTYEDAKQVYAGAPLQFMGLVCLNCCLPYSEGIDKLCQYLNDVPFPKYKAEDVGYSIPWVVSRIRLKITGKVISVSDFSTWIAKYRMNLPTNLPDSRIVCRDLSATGNFLYLPSSQDLAKGWLVLDLPCILHEVYGTIFSPFKQPIADQFGLVGITTLAKLFPTWSPDLICDILIALEFAIKVDSTMCRELKGLSSGSEGGSEEFYPQQFFFPALVSSQQRANVFKESSFTLRWLFRVNRQLFFITPFLLQSIVHRLTTKLVLYHEQGSSKYQCRVWYNGIFWQTSSVDIAVQVSDSSVLQVIATSDTNAEELFKYTTAVIGDISSTIHELSPSLSGSSYIIYPGEPQTLLENPQAPSPLHMFPVEFILDSLKKNQTTCLSLMDEDCPATRMSILSLFCSFHPTTIEASQLLLLNQSDPKSTGKGNVASGSVTTLLDMETTPTTDHQTTPTTNHQTMPTTNHQTTPTTDHQTTPTTDHQTTPTGGRMTTEQLLDKYKDFFKSDSLNSHSINQHLKIDKVIPEEVFFAIENADYRKGNLLLFQHLQMQGDLEALRWFCKVLIQVGEDGNSRMLQMGKDLQSDLYNCSV